MDPLAHEEKLLHRFAQNLVTKALGERHSDSTERHAENEGNERTLEQTFPASSPDATSTSSKSLQLRDNTNSPTEINDSVATGILAAVSLTPLQLSASDLPRTTTDSSATALESHSTTASLPFPAISGETTGITAMASSPDDQIKSGLEKSLSLPPLESDAGRNDDDERSTETQSQLVGMDLRTAAANEILEVLPDLSQKHDILRQLFGKLMGNRMLVLIGEAGSGKTTAAPLVARSASVWSGVEFVTFMYYGDEECLPKTVATYPSRCIIIIEDFLGRHDTDSLSYWNAVVPLLESMRDNVDKEILLLLTSRTAIFQNLLRSEEASVRMFLNENHVTTITTDYHKMWTDICKSDKMKPPDFENSPSICFPLCCQLAPHLAPTEQTILFQQPRLALRITVRALMDSTGIAITALTLLAVTKRSLDMCILKHLPRLQESIYYEILNFFPQAQSDEETSALIIEFYNTYAYLFQVCNDTVTFRSEFIREAVLLVLCDSHAELLAKYCSLELLSQIALVSSDKDTSDDAKKIPLPDSFKSVLMKRLITEINANNFDAMFSPVFQHHSILDQFENTMKEKGLLKQWTQKSSRSGLHFVFYAGAVPSVFKTALSELDKRNIWVVLQAVLACCYWDYDNDIPALMKVWKNKTEFKKALKEATILDIVTGNLPGLSRREEPRWEMTPLFPEDTLLVLAARRGNDDVVKTLAFREMNVNSQGMDGRTALMHYCARGSRDMVKFLLDRKADPEIRDKRGMTAMMYALQQKKWDIPEKLMTTESCLAVNTYLQSPLTIACAHDWSTEMIGTLSEKGADLLQKDKWGYTCLHYACLHGHTDIVAYLLKKKKLDVREKSAFGHTPLTLAVTSPGRSDLVKLLHSKTAKNADDLEVANMVCRASDSSVLQTLLLSYCQKAYVKNYALHAASKYGNIEMVRYLVKSGADVAVKSPGDEWSVLHSACNGFSVECCEMLLNKIDPNVETRHGFTPLMFALQAGALDCARLLLHRGAKLNPGSCLHYAVLSHLCSTLDWCIKEHKMDVNVKDHAGKTPLHTACELGFCHSVKCLLDNGAEMLLADDNGDTCLHHAARNGHWYIFNLILEKGDPSLLKVQNKSGETPGQLFTKWFKQH